MPANRVVSVLLCCECAFAVNWPELATLADVQALKVGAIIDVFERSKVFHTGVVIALDTSLEDTISAALR